MANLKYFTKGKSDPTTIYLRFTHGRKIDLKKSTTLLIKPKYWNNNKGKVNNVSSFKDKLNLQNELNNLSNYILNSFNRSYSAGVTIDSHWLDTAIKKYFNQTDDIDMAYLYNYAKYYYSNLSTKVLNNGQTGVSNSTIKKYNTVLNKIKDFEKHSNKKLKVIDIDTKFQKDFINFLHQNQNLNLNTSGKYLKFIKTICYDAKTYGIKLSNDLENRLIKIPSEKTTFITLSEGEIKEIYNYKLSDKPYLENARDWLIIGLWTGARVSDLLSLTNNNIKNDFIEFTAQKTKQKIILPLHWQVKEILHNRRHNFPRKISAQRFNDYIKEVCRIVGISNIVEGSKNCEIKKNVWRKVKGKYKKYELVSSHICRRSFATNHYGKLPTPVIMSITGHTTEKMFLNYIGKTPSDNAEVLKEYWQKLEKIRNKKNNLSVVKNGTDKF